MLVPGSAGFNSLLQLLTDQTVSGITAGFDTFVTAMSIAYGLIGLDGRPAAPVHAGDAAHRRSSRRLVLVSTVEVTMQTIPQRPPLAAARR